MKQRQFGAETGLARRGSLLQRIQASGCSVLGR